MSLAEKESHCDEIDPGKKYTARSIIIDYQLPREAVDSPPLEVQGQAWWGLEHPGLVERCRCSWQGVKWDDI